MHALPSWECESPVRRNSSERERERWIERARERERRQEGKNDFYIEEKTEKERREKWPLNQKGLLKLDQCE